MRSSSTRPSHTEGSGPASEAPQVPEVLVEASGLTRRQLLRRGVAAGLAVGAAGVLDAPAAGAAQPTKSLRLRDGLANPTGIHPFRVKVPNKQLAALRRRVTETRWPSMELVADRSQGVQLATAQALARFWTTRYDWRRFEAKLNGLPQFRTEIDGLDIHFIHVRSPHQGALPLIMTHGWPGSIVELLETVEPLTNPTTHGGRAADAFDLVLPSIPGYGFSGQPTELGWDTGRVARAWAELMRVSAMAAMSPRVATSGPSSPMRWAARHPRGCSAST
jgi:Epoxide hydrolase N terminus